MRQVVSSVAVLLALASLVGCATPKTVAAPANLHTSVAMDEATARALLADDDLVPVSITTITGADFYVTVPANPTVATDLPDERGPVNVLRTWGVDPTDPPSGIPDTRE